MITVDYKNYKSFLGRFYSQYKYGKGIFSEIGSKILPIIFFIVPLLWLKNIQKRKYFDVLTLKNAVFVSDLSSAFPTIQM